MLWASVGMQTIYTNYDGPYYLVIARCWYDKECIGRNFSFPLPLEYYPAHFPLYPVLINTIAASGISKLQAMVLVNVMAAAGAAIMLHKLVADNKWGHPLLISLAWLFVWPRMWVVRSIGSPETLLMLFIFVSVYFFGKKKYLGAAFWGSMAVLTKPPGVLLLAAYGCWWLYEGIKNRKWHVSAWPVSLMAVVLAGIFWFYQVRTGDTFAYFHSGDNIHLQALPFKIFDSSQAWVGTFWLEDVLWIYLIGVVGIWRAFKKSTVLGWFGAVWYATILFVSHRDIARYSLPIVPVVLIGLAEIFEKREVRWAMVFLLVPSFLYSVNFLVHNTAGVATWQPFL